MKNILIFLTALHIWLLPEMLQAQQVQVLDKSDLQPIPGANILVKSAGAQRNYITNLNGYAEITAAATDSVFVKFIGYQTFKGTAATISRKKNKIYLTEDVLLLDEVVLSASKKQEERENQPTRVEVVNQKQIAFNNPQTSADLLQQTGKVFVQQSQMGGGSPVIRGFEANKVLIVVDGVRMNNAIFRGGHLQNAITIDPNMLDRAEVVFGPGSVMYGSDALGGVMHFYTRKPQLSIIKKPYVKTNAFLRYATANQEKSGHLNFNIGFKKVAVLAGFTYKDFDDLRAGNIHNPMYPDFGKRNFYVKRVDGKDSVYKNTDPNLQVGSGYSQYDIFGKVLISPSDKWDIVLNHQNSRSSDIPRYDRLTEVRNGKPRFAEWYYGPQVRMLNSLQSIFYNQNAVYDKFTVTAAHQFLVESRIDRPLNGKERRHREETVNVYSVNADAGKDLTEKNELQYGAEFIYNTVDSKAFTEEINTGSRGPLDTRYPDGGSNMTTAAAYITHTWKILPNLIFSQGVRGSYVGLNAEFKDTTFFNFPFDKNISHKNTAVNGNLGLVYRPDSSWKFSAIASSGFRAPNVDDLAKVFESTPGNLIIPNPNLKPEYTYNAELSIGKNIGEIFKIEATGFYTWFTDAIVTRPYLYNGQDSIIYQGQRSRVQANVNTQNAYLYGVQGEVILQATEAVALLSSLTYTYGRVKQDNMPLDHIPPMYGQTALRLEVARFKGEFFVRYNDWKLLKDYSTSGEDNLQYALPQGMPGWYTLNARADYQLTQFLKIQTGVENIMDKHYRQFASGISAPGRNFYVALRGSF